MGTLAWRNLVHDKVRLTVTVTGIVFAVVLIVVQLGLFLGFTTTTSSLIDRSSADLWITSSRVPYIEQGVPFSERKLTTVLATPGVRTASEIHRAVHAVEAAGRRQESVQVVGIDAGPGWAALEHRRRDARRSSQARRGLRRRNLQREARCRPHRPGRRNPRPPRAHCRVHARHPIAFTTSPYVFTTFKNALELHRAARRPDALHTGESALAGADSASCADGSRRGSRTSTSSRTTASAG